APAPALFHQGCRPSSTCPPDQSSAPARPAPACLFRLPGAKSLRHCAPASRCHLLALQSSTLPWALDLGPSSYPHGPPEERPEQRGELQPLARPSAAN